VRHGSFVLNFGDCIPDSAGRVASSEEWRREFHRNLEYPLKRETLQLPDWRSLSLSELTSFRGLPVKGTLEDGQGYSKV